MALLGTANAVVGLIGGVGGLFGGGGRPKGPTTERIDGARWSAKKQYWELPPGQRAAVQSPKPKYPGVQDMAGNVVTGALPAPAVPSAPTTAGGVLTAIGQALSPAQPAGVPTYTPSPTSPDMIALYVALAAGAVLIFIAARRGG